MTLPPQQSKTKNPTERAKEHLRQIKEGETIEADANQCGFYILRSKPSHENLEHLLGKPNAAYIMAGNDLYYFNKVEKIHLTRIKLDEKKSLKLKDELRDLGLDEWSLTDGETSKRLINKLSIKQLKKITEITGHDQKEEKLWSALKTIPLLTGLIIKAESTGHSFTSLEQLTHFSKSLTVQPGENASPINKIKSDDSPSPVNTAPVSVIKDSKTPLSAHSNSITDIAERLYGNEARRILKEQYGKDLSIDTLDDTLNTYLSVKDEQNRQQGIIKFFAEQAKHIYHHSPKASSEDIFDFFERLNNFDKSAVKLLNQALSNYNAHPRDFNLGKESIKVISAFPAFREALSKKGIDDSLLNQPETMVTDNSNASPELTEDSSEGESEGPHLSQHL